MNPLVEEPFFEVLAYESTELGPLCLRLREVLCDPGTIITEVTLNHEFLMSSYHTDSERALAATALRMHTGPKLRVLVGGLGLGYTANAVLGSSRVETCEVIEFLPQVIRWMEDGMIPLSDTLKADRRLQIKQGDIYRNLREPPEQQFDLILIDVDHSPDDNLGDHNNNFYSEEGLVRAKQHLAPGGILGVWSYAESSPFVDALDNVFNEVHLEPVTAFNRLIKEEQTDWLFFARN